MTQSNKKMRPYWSKECCTGCGLEGYASRTNDVPKSKVYVCSECEIYASAYEEGYDQGFARASNIIGKLRKLLKE